IQYRRYSRSFVSSTLSIELRLVFSRKNIYTYLIQILAIFLNKYAEWLTASSNPSTSSRKSSMAGSSEAPPSCTWMRPPALKSCRPKASRTPTLRTSNTAPRRRSRAARPRMFRSRQSSPTASASVSLLLPVIRPLLSSSLRQCLVQPCLALPKASLVSAPSSLQSASVPSRMVLRAPLSSLAHRLGELFRSRSIVPSRPRAREVMMALERLKRFLTLSSLSRQSPSDVLACRLLSRRRPRDALARSPWIQKSARLEDALTRSPRFPCSARLEEVLPRCRLFMKMKTPERARASSPSSAVSNAVSNAVRIVMSSAMNSALSSSTMSTAVRSVLIIVSRIIKSSATSSTVSSTVSSELASASFNALRRTSSSFLSSLCKQLRPMTTTTSLAPMIRPSAGRRRMTRIRRCSR
ncbi:hypothetical protein B0H63DRAFT_548854, partial [Podospora didyma]